MTDKLEFDTAIKLSTKRIWNGTLTIRKHLKM